MRLYSRYGASLTFFRALTNGFPRVTHLSKVTLQTVHFILFFILALPRQYLQFEPQLCIVFLAAAHQTHRQAPRSVAQTPLGRRTVWCTIQCEGLTLLRACTKLKRGQRLACLIFSGKEDNYVNFTPELTVPNRPYIIFPNKYFSPWSNCWDLSWLAWHLLGAEVETVLTKAETKKLIKVYKLPMLTCIILHGRLGFWFWFGFGFYVWLRRRRLYVRLNEISKYNQHLTNLFQMFCIWDRKNRRSGYWLCVRC